MRIYAAPARDFIEAALVAEIDECVIWPFAVRKSSGYAAYQRSRGNGPRSIDAHRHVCILAYGLPPLPKHEAAHKCGNRLCINPRHLYWAIALENMDDAKRHGRLRGGGIYRQRLFEQERAEIAASKESLVTLAARYGMEPSHIGRIRRMPLQFDL